MKVLLILTLLICGLTLTANAQMTTLSGKIYDYNGAVIAGANIKLKDSGGKKVHPSFTNEEGLYKFEISEGFYSLEIFANGFKKYRIKKFWIPSKYIQKIFLDVVLETDGKIIEDTIYPEKIKRKNNK